MCRPCENFGTYETRVPDETLRRTVSLSVWVGVRLTKSVFRNPIPISSWSEGVMQLTVFRIALRCSLGMRLPRRDDVELILG